MPGVRTVVDLSRPIDLEALNFRGSPHLSADLGGAQRFLPLNSQKIFGEALRGTVVVDYLKLLDAVDGELDSKPIVQAVFSEFQSRGISEAQVRTIVGKLERFVRYK